TLCTLKYNNFVSEFNNIADDIDNNDIDNDIDDNSFDQTSKDI
ncbi:6475_t:CDS:1, partial [Funneliformis mosseae]